jgi:ankyrin repeat protein
MQNQHTIDQALIYAVQNGHIATVKLLLNYGANTNADKDQPLRNAAHGHTDIVKLLLDHGAKHK